MARHSSSKPNRTHTDALAVPQLLASLSRLLARQVARGSNCYDASVPAAESRDRRDVLSVVSPRPFSTLIDGTATKRRDRAWRSSNFRLSYGTGCRRTESYLVRDRRASSAQLARQVFGVGRHDIDRRIGLRGWR